LGTSYEFYNYATPNSTFGVHCGDYAAHHLTTGGTINAWVYHNFGTFYGGMVAGNEDENLDSDGYALTIASYAAPDNEPRVAADFADDSTWLHVMGNTHVTEGAWHMATLTWDSNIKLYLDGSIDALSGRTVTPTFTGPTTEFCIGRSPSIWSPYPFCKTDAIPGTGKGKIDEVGLWSRALTSSEITQLYNSGSGLTYSSDIRLKTDIKFIRKSSSGINIYQFRYIKSQNIKGLYEGVIAQELLGTIFEDAVSINPNTGYYQVDYNKVDVEFKLIDKNKK
jgi:hypothetical protein